MQIENEYLYIFYHMKKKLKKIVYTTYVERKKTTTKTEVVEG